MLKRLFDSHGVLEEFWLVSQATYANIILGHSTGYTSVGVSGITVNMPENWHVNERLISFYMDMKTFGGVYSKSSTQQYFLFPGHLSITLRQSIYLVKVCSKGDQKA